MVASLGRGIVGVAAVGLLAGFFCPAAAQAGECAGQSGAAPLLGEQKVEARLQFVRQSLRDTARLERRYLLGWNLSYLGMAAGTWFLYPFAADQRGQRISSAWNTATSLAASLTVLIDPLRVIGDQHRLEALLSQPAAADQRCAVLAKAEKLLAHVAENETGARSSRSHIISFFTTVGLGLILGYALQRGESAAINTSIGVVLSEVMIATRPTLAIRRLESYRSGNLDATAPPPTHLSWAIVPTVTTTTYGAALGGAF